MRFGPDARRTGLRRPRPCTHSRAASVPTYALALRDAKQVSPGYGHDRGYPHRTQPRIRFSGASSRASPVSAQPTRPAHHPPEPPFDRLRGNWRRRGSNPQPPHCERGALPVELRPQVIRIVNPSPAAATARHTRPSAVADGAARPPGIRPVTASPAGGPPTRPSGPGRPSGLSSGTPGHRPDDGGRCGNGRTARPGRRPRRCSGGCCTRAPR